MKMMPALTCTGSSKKDLVEVYRSEFIYLSLAFMDGWMDLTFKVHEYTFLHNTLERGQDLKLDNNKEDG